MYGGCVFVLARNDIAPRRKFDWLFPGSEVKGSEYDIGERKDNIEILTHFFMMSPMVAIYPFE